MGVMGGLSFYLQAHHLEILPLLYCMVAKILLWYQHLFATPSTDYMLGTGNHTNTINCKSIMTTSLSLGRTDQALTQHNLNMIVVDSAFTPPSISLSTLTFLWETTFFHCRLSQQTMKVPKAMGQVHNSNQGKETGRNLIHEHNNTRQKIQKLKYFDGSAL